jgi:A/G-specific adenine glycosylase
VSKKFTQQLLRWNELENTREMPWKGKKDPYLIWLSEIILQQTRVEQGLPYFERFIKQYPKVENLAHAPEDEVMKLWQGLGYYSRARNLHFTAKYITENYKGKFPKTFAELRQLKGVGDYTAAAIASFAFGENVAVVDGNVIRVLGRVFGVATPFDTTAGKKEFAQLAQSLTDSKNIAAYNQSIMDFGAVVCTPRAPKCEDCPFQKQCVAYTTEAITNYPVRAKKTLVTERFFNYFIIKNKTSILVEKRVAKDIWQNLYQFPLIETDKAINKQFDKLAERFLGHKKFTIKSVADPQTQLLSHRKMNFRFIEIELKDWLPLLDSMYEKVDLKELSKLAFPRTLHLYLKENQLI